MGRDDRGGGDIEAGLGNGGGNQLYPGQTDSPELRWAFIRKVYTILSCQLILTAAVAAYVVRHPDLAVFMSTTLLGLAIYIALIISVLLLMIPLHYYQRKHPLNLILLMVFTVVMALLIGLACATKKGDVILLAATLTSAVVIGLTLYTFWAVKRGQDFSFLGPFLFCALLLLILFSLIQIFMPLGELGRTMWCLVGALVFSGFLVYDTDNIIKNYTYDEYVGASISLYMDIINLFLMILGLGGDD